MRIEAGDACQLPIDGVSNEKIKKFIIPRDGIYDLGEEILYEFDKYVWDRDGDCVLDYQNTFGGIEDQLLELNENKTEGEICALNFYFTSAFCGYGCPERKREIYIFYFKDYLIPANNPNLIEREQNSEYYRFWWLILNLIVIFPWACLQALGTKYEFLFYHMEPIIREMFPPGLSNWMYYINDEEANSQLDFFEIDQTQYDNNEPRYEI